MCFPGQATGQSMRETLWGSDSALRALIEASPLAVIAIDADEKIRTWNAAAIRIFGWSEGEVLGQPPPYVPEDKQAEFHALHQQQMRGESASGLELRRRRKDGSLIDVSLWTVPLRDAAGGFVGAMGLLDDITERKHAEATLALRTSQIDAIRGLTLELTQTLEVAPLLEIIHRRAVELVGVQSGVLYLWDEATQELVSTVRYGHSRDLPAVRLRRGEGVAGAVAQRREGLIVNDFRASPYVTPWFLEHTTHTAVLAEPLVCRDGFFGVISLSNIQMPQRAFNGRDRDLLRLFAAHAAIAIQNAELFQGAERQRREIELVADLSQQLNASLDYHTVLQRVVEGARDLTQSDLAQIALRDELSDTLVFRYRAGSQSDRLDTHRIEHGKGVGGMVVATGKPFRTENYAQDPRITKDYLPHTLAQGVVAELGVPIRLAGRVEGVLFVDNRSSRPFTDGDERTLLRLADHAAIAIRNARLHTTAVHRAQHFGTLNIVMQALTTELDPLLVTRRVLEAMQTLIRGSVGILRDLPEGAEALRVVASIGLRDADAARSLRLRVGEGLAGIAAATREPVVSTGVAWDPQFKNRSWAASEGLVSGIVLPLVVRGRVTGTLAVFLRRPHTFHSEEVEVLQALAAESAIALENARLFEQVDAGRERLVDLTRRVVSAQEEERGRLSRELHDEAGQALTALRISLGLIRDDLPIDAALLRPRLEDAVKVAESITDQLRFLAQALRPPALDAVGLDATLEGLCHDFSKRTQLPIDYAGAGVPRISDGIGIHLYRFLQEALTNIGKHARARRVRVALAYDGEMLSLSVEDEGVGFDVAQTLGAQARKGMGLLGMQERLDLLNGRLEIKSRPGHGTRLLARVPWKDAP